MPMQDNTIPTYPYKIINNFVCTNVNWPSFSSHKLSVFGAQEIEFNVYLACLNIHGAYIVILIFQTATNIFINVQKIII